MRKAVLFLGCLLILAAIVVLAGDALRYFETGAIRPMAAGELWFQLHRSSLNMLQAGIERNVSEELWPWVVAILKRPASLVLALPGLLLILLARPWRRLGGGRPRRRYFK